MSPGVSSKGLENCHIKNMLPPCHQNSVVRSLWRWNILIHLEWWKGGHFVVGPGEAYCPGEPESGSLRGTFWLKGEQLRIDWVEIWSRNCKQLPPMSIYKQKINPFGIIFLGTFPGSKFGEKSIFPTWQVLGEALKLLQKTRPAWGGGGGAGRSRFFSGIARELSQRRGARFGLLKPFGVGKTPWILEVFVGDCWSRGFGGQTLSMFFCQKNNVVMVERWSLMKFDVAW